MFGLTPFVIGLSRHIGFYIYHAGGGKWSGSPGYLRLSNVNYPTGGGWSGLFFLFVLSVKNSR